MFIFRNEYIDAATVTVGDLTEGLTNDFDR